MNSIDLARLHSNLEKVAASGRLHCAACGAIARA
jgi:hypothetical protein